MAIHNNHRTKNAAILKLSPFLNNGHIYEVNGALPHHGGACKITHERVIYRKVNPNASVKYCPVKSGGSLNMEPGLVAKYPFLGEFSYLKMLAVMVLQTWNIERVHK